MPSIKDLEMAAAVSTYKNISIKKSLFSKKAVYEPTQSAVKVTIRDYSPTEGERLECLLSLPTDRLAAELQQKGAPVPVPVGHYRLEVCLSADCQFCALQLFRFVDFKYSPCSDARFYEGKEAAVVAGLLG